MRHNYLKVPLGIETKNEANLKEMAQILDSLNKYVPVQCNDSTAEGGILVPRVIFGDQLTVARIRGAAVLRSYHSTVEEKLKGFVGTISDWHARLCLVTVSIKLSKYPLIIIHCLYTTDPCKSTLLIQVCW